MKPGKRFRAGLLLVMVAGLLAASELKGAPRAAIQSPTGLYLLAQYKLAMGDTSSGLELLDRALADGDSQLPRAGTLNACNITVHTRFPLTVPPGRVSSSFGYRNFSQKTRARTQVYICNLRERRYSEFSAITSDQTA